MGWNTEQARTVHTQEHRQRLHSFSIRINSISLQNRWDINHIIFSRSTVPICTACYSHCSSAVRSHLSFAVPPPSAWACCPLLSLTPRTVLLSFSFLPG